MVPRLRIQRSLLINFLTVVKSVDIHLCRATISVSTFRQVIVAPSGIIRIIVVVAILPGYPLIAVVRVITLCPGGSAFSIIEQSEVFIAPAHGSLCTRCYFVASRGVAIFTLQNNILSFNGWHSRSVSTGCLVAIVTSVIIH